MPRKPIPTWCFAVVIVRKGDDFLIVHEQKHGQKWYFPAGRVEIGETFAEAAIRETEEEAGILVNLTGVLRVEYTPGSHATRMRVVFVAEPADDSPLKSVPDAESLEAAWVSLDNLSKYPLRGIEVRQLFEYVARGAPVYPLSLIQPEGKPYRVIP